MLNVDKKAKKLDLSRIVGVTGLRYSHSRKQLSPSFQNETYTNHTTQQLHSWTFIPEKWKLHPHNYSQQVYV